MKKLFVLFVAMLLLVGVGAGLPGKAKNDKGPLTKLTFIHYKKAFGKPPWAGGGKEKPDKGTKCYEFLSSGAKWKTTESYQINPTNDDGVDETKVVDAVEAGVYEWETYGGDIFAKGLTDYAADYNDGNLDYLNTVSFGAYYDDNVIGVTTVWGYFNGPPKMRELVEWDMLLNDYYDWGIGGAAMDVQNIVTHELGHAAGMDDLYDTACSEETMYGYSIEGETSKRDLNSGDIEGIQKLYG